MRKHKLLKIHGLRHFINDVYVFDDYILKDVSYGKGYMRVVREGDGEGFYTLVEDNSYPPVTDEENEEAIDIVFDYVDKLRIKSLERQI